MKATELMIGNWVKIKGDYGKPLKITTIDDTYNSINYFDGDAEGELTLQLNEIEPIPLTLEILEKNGFIKQNFDGWEYIHPNDSTFSYIDYRILWRTDYDNHLFIKKYKGSNIFATLQISRINYVHQLQQALMFCEIEKEIVL